MNRLLILTLTAIFSSFAAAAINNTPKLSVSETTFKTIDRNADGFISLTEAENIEALLATFPDLDLNRDGNLTEAEYEKFLTIVQQNKNDQQH